MKGPYIIDTALGKATIYSGKPVDEIAQLKARVMELEDVLKDFWFDLPVNSDSEREIRKLLNRTPQQSLEAHDREVAARALEEFANNGDFDGALWAIGQAMIDHATQIRAGGEKG